MSTSTPRRHRAAPEDASAVRSPGSGPRAAAPDLSDRKPTKPDMVAVRSPEPAESADVDPYDRPTAHDPLSGRGAAPAVGRVRAVLICLSGASAGRTFMLRKDQQTRVGRDRDAEVRLDDDGVSRAHAAFMWQADQFWIADLGSRNGTTVNGQLVSKRHLVDGAIIRFGAQTAFRFAFVDEQTDALLRQLYDSSVRDLLTQAYNRQYFDQRLRSEVAYATRHNASLGLCLFDLDHFKKVNDTYGHPGGDAVLRYVGGIALSRLRTEDVFARYGGEEFAVILRGVEVEGTARAAERLRGAIGGTAPCHEGRFIPVTISAGCATLRCCAAPRVDELIAIADRRLYAAKKAGRNRVVATDA